MREETAGINQFKCVAPSGWYPRSGGLLSALCAHEEEGQGEPGWKKGVSVETILLHYMFAFWFLFFYGPSPLEMLWLEETLPLLVTVIFWQLFQLELRKPSSRRIRMMKTFQNTYWFSPARFCYWWAPKRFKIPITHLWKVTRTEKSKVKFLYFPKGHLLRKTEE